MKKHFFTFLALIMVSFILISWGGTGHNKINTAAGLSFNTQMAQFNSWIATLAAHASDADERKSWDPTEGPKHYIDIDNYSEFVALGRIPQTLDSAIAMHSASFVYDNGILPWATLTTYDSLISCFERQDWTKAVLFAADLGHYVADGHMPFHITRNYNGQFTGNTGIHSRYESTMINTYISQIVYEGADIAPIDNVNQYVFNYLYASYPYVDSVIAADNYAKALAGNTSSATYKQALWEKTNGYTIPLFSKASHALAELIYTAWISAGSPLISPDFIFTNNNQSDFLLQQNQPNPFKSSTKIQYNIIQNSEVLLQVFDIKGNNITTLVNEQKETGTYTIDWNTGDIAGGVYYLRIKSGKYFGYKKMVVLE